MPDQARAKQTPRSAFTKQFVDETHQ